MAMPAADSEEAVESGISVSHDAYSEEGISVDDLVDHIWKLPKAKRRAKL